MPNLFSKDEDLKKSAPIVGFEILKQLQDTEESRISIFDLANKLRKKNKLNVRSLYYGMLFLYSLDAIKFDEPYLINNVKN